MSDTILGLENLDPTFYIIFYSIIFVLGICIGSFLNVVICRLPKGESLIKLRQMRLKNKKMRFNSSY